MIVRADMPETAAGTNVVVRVPMPRNAVSVHSEVHVTPTARRRGVEGGDCGRLFVPFRNKAGAVEFVFPVLTLDRRYRHGVHGTGRYVDR